MKRERIQSKHVPCTTSHIAPTSSQYSNRLWDFEDFWVNEKYSGQVSRVHLLTAIQFRCLICTANKLMNGVSSIREEEEERMFASLWMFAFDALTTFFSTSISKVNRLIGFSSAVSSKWNGRHSRYFRVGKSCVR